MRQLHAPAVEKRARPHEDSIGPFAAHRRKGSIDLGARIGLEDLNLQSHGASSHVRTVQLGFGIWISRIEKQCDAGELRHALT